LAQGVSPSPVARKHRKLIVFTDGASRNNPGEAGVGVVIKDEDGNTVKTFSHYLGIATNNVAEYTALLDALELLSRQPADEIEIHLDSQLVVRQVLGEYKVKQPHLLPLVERVREKMATFPKITLSHVPREMNAEADALANKAIDNKIKMD
jgi:ribonuclease HI